MSEISSIRTHLEQMLPDDLAREIGATEDKPTPVRVLRVLDALVDARTERNQLRETVKRLNRRAQRAEAASGVVKTTAPTHQQQTQAP